ncbi:MAG: TetR/AcrR family transcriptional regulator [Rhizobiaceae bacterium]
MARPRSFDADDVLSAAMHCFRRLGYERVSIKDLERATGLSSGSLYNSFTNKEGVFRAALEHYVDVVIRARLLAFAGPEATLDDLEGLFLSIWEMPQADGFGCLVTNSAVEFGPDAPAFASARVTEGLNLSYGGIRSLLIREIGAVEAEREAPALALLYHGVLVYSRARVLDETHRDAVRATFNRLRALRTTD